MARVRLADLNGPKWTSSGQNGPKWTILVHFGLATFGPFRTILVQYTFRQYRGHSLKSKTLLPVAGSRSRDLCHSCQSLLLLGRDKNTMCKKKHGPMHWPFLWRSSRSPSISAVWALSFLSFVFLKFLVFFFFLSSARNSLFF